jgi:hypothetical protein
MGDLNPLYTSHPISMLWPHTWFVSSLFSDYNFVSASHLPHACYMTSPSNCNGFDRPKANRKNYDAFQSFFLVGQNGLPTVLKL